MTLFEAIRGLKEGQAIRVVSPSGLDWDYAIWFYGQPAPVSCNVLVQSVNLDAPVSIVDLPKPKITLEEA